MLKILIAVDGSELSLDGVHHALTLVRQGLQATMVLANVQEPATLYELVTTRDPGGSSRATCIAPHTAAPAEPPHSSPSCRISCRATRNESRSLLLIQRSTSFTSSTSGMKS